MMVLVNWCEIEKQKILGHIITAPPKVFLSVNLSLFEDFSLQISQQLLNVNLIVFTNLSKLSFSDLFRFYNALKEILDTV